MSIGVLGTIKPSDVNINDIDIYYNYTPNRETNNNDILKIDDPNSLLSYCYLPETDGNFIAGNENILDGLYNLTLPATIFNQLGIYTIYIKPKTITTTIIDCSVLSSLPTVKGIVLDSNLLPENLRTNNALQGYRVEYIDTSGNKLRNVVRYVVTSNKVVPISENIGNTSQKSIRYRFDDSGTLIFLQVSPSSSSDVKANVYPFIGIAGQTILISNTFFSPLTLEIEMVENTLDSLSGFITGNQAFDLTNGIKTHYDPNNNNAITYQYNVFEIKDDVGNVPLYNVVEKRTNIDSSQDFDQIVSDIL
jgi:hypothetical protein